VVLIALGVARTAAGNLLSRRGKLSFQELRLAVGLSSIDKPMVHGLVPAVVLGLEAAEQGAALSIARDEPGAAE
jgi:hypothetical protein